MSIFDSLVQTAIQSALGGSADSAQNQTQNLVKGVLGMLQNDSIGGIAGLVDKFKQSGLADVAASWIGTGANKAVSPNQLVDALGKEQVEELAVQAGIPAEKGATVLSQVLPSIVDKLTPDGDVPEASHLGTLAKVVLGGAGIALAAKAASSMFGGSDAQAAEAPVQVDAASVAAPSAPAQAATVNTYTVVSGDSLSKIAQKTYGDGNLWSRIYEANRDQLSNPDHITPGQVLRIP